MFKAMSPLLIPHICVVLCLAYLGLVPAHAHSEDTATATHGMMIDAGTEGSRVHVFSWDNVRFLLLVFIKILTLLLSDRYYVMSLSVLFFKFCHSVYSDISPFR